LPSFINFNASSVPMPIEKEGRVELGGNNDKSSQKLEVRKNEFIPKAFSHDIFMNDMNMGPTTNFDDDSLLTDSFFTEADESISLSSEHSMFSRARRSSNSGKEDLKGVRTVTGIKKVNNLIENKFFRKGLNYHTVLDTNLSGFYTEKFCDTWGFFTILHNYKNRNFAVYRYRGPSCTPLSLQLQEKQKITICGIWHTKFWNQIRNNSQKDGEKAINLFVDANNTRILDGDILVCKSASHEVDVFSQMINLQSTADRVCYMELAKSEHDDEVHELIRHLILRLLACLQVVQIPKQYHGKSLKELGIQNDGLTIWSTIQKNGGESKECYVDANTQLQNGQYVVVKKSRKDADLEEKCNLFSRGELGWCD